MYAAGRSGFDLIQVRMKCCLLTALQTRGVKRKLTLFILNTWDPLSWINSNELNMRQPSFFLHIYVHNISLNRMPCWIIKCRCNKYYNSSFITDSVCWMSNRKTCILYGYIIQGDTIKQLNLSSAICFQLSLIFVFWNCCCIKHVGTSFEIQANSYLVSST